MDRVVTVVSRCAFGLASSFLVFGCAAHSSFVLTGSARPASPEDSPVKPFLTGMPEHAYEEIGVVEVRGYSLKDRVERAAEVAREQGGNAVILLSSTVRVESSPVGGGGAVVLGGPPYGMFAMRAPGNAVSSYEVDRYIVARLEDAD